SGTVQEMSEWVEYMTFKGVSPMADQRKENGHEEPWVVDYFGVGNENWGCGGNMRPEYYGDLFRRYQTYIRNYDHEHPVAKIACGANGGDYHWTEKVLETCFDHGFGYMNGLSLHYYTVPYGNWAKKGSATDFSKEDWYSTMEKTMYMETLIKRHGAIMDQFDPDKRIGMIIDEWGTWYDVEPGTNPGFLYQQNTIRDALVAGINLNLFNKNCDRVKMANIAQMVNVLQSVLLTEGKKMVKTPTWHVFNLYKVHQDNDLVESTLIGNSEAGIGELKAKKLTESVTVDKDGKLYLTMTNMSLDASEVMEVVLGSGKVKSVKGQIVTGKMDAHNTFKAPNKVQGADFDAVTVTKEGLTFELPARSVVLLEITLKK
ncbi:MAG: alpha-N-arabinofuranosidase, partial [Lachnospiraceae bacterium]|nr:alpha-N-arabinofuranosidase [Lachnospiraceae bacterium]